MVGMSPWVVHRDKDVFGEDAGVWRPERWLDCDSEQRRKMEAGLLTVRCLSPPIAQKPLPIFPKLAPRRPFPPFFSDPHNPWWHSLTNLPFY